MAMRLALAVIPWRWLLRAPRPRSTADAGAVQVVQWAIGVCERRLPAQTCLSSALAAQRLLARRGVAVTVEIGTYRDEQGATVFHALASCGGVPIVGAREMTVLASVPE
jgi:hypothetical protein